jgi:hypothetical protein
MAIAATKRAYRRARRQKINRGAAGSNIVYCDISTISESPVTAGVIWKEHLPETRLHLPL